jgi:hypothetical protein
VVLTTHPLLAPRSGKSRAIPLPPLWTFGPVTGYLYLYVYYLKITQNKLKKLTKEKLEETCGKNT